MSVKETGRSRIAVEIACRLWEGLQVFDVGLVRCNSTLQAASTRTEKTGFSNAPGLMWANSAATQDPQQERRTLSALSLWSLRAQELSPELKEAARESGVVEATGQVSQRSKTIRASSEGRGFWQAHADSPSEERRPLGSHL